MTLYLDTSTLMKLYVDESDSAEVADLVARASVVITSRLAYPEARAAFARLRRERFLTPVQHDMAVRKLDDDWSRWLVIDLDAEIAHAAGTLSDRHSLTGGDAVHLASFEMLIPRVEDEMHFSCADERLTRAARALV